MHMIYIYIYINRHTERERERERAEEEEDLQRRIDAASKFREAALADFA